MVICERIGKSKMTVTESFAKALNEILLEEKQSLSDFLKDLMYVYNALNEKETRTFFLSPVNYRRSKKNGFKKSFKIL